MIKETIKWTENYPYKTFAILNMLMLLMLLIYLGMPFEMSKTIERGGWMTGNYDDESTLYYCKWIATREAPVPPFKVLENYYISDCEGIKCECRMVYK